MNRETYKTETPLLAWMRENVNDDWAKDMFWRRDAINQMIGFRDQIAPLFLAPETAGEEYQAFARIGNWHMSKSILLPVYHFCTPTIEVAARDNFYNWNVTISSLHPVELPDYFDIDRLEGYLFFEGMELIRSGPYRDSKTQFSFATHSIYSLYAIMWCIASQTRR